MNIITRQFEGHAVHTFEWEGRPCWIATEIVALFEYADASKTIQQCIEAEEFEEGVEYEVLRGKQLREFKRLSEVTTAEVVTYLKYAPQLTLFYEDGIYGFLQYTHKPVGIRFRKWIRSEVVPAIRKEGAYTLPGGEKPKLGRTKKATATLPSVNNAARIMLKAMAEANVPEQDRLSVLADLYRQAGVNLQLPRPGPPAPQSATGRLLTEEYQGLKAATAHVTPAEWEDDLQFILAMPVSPKVKQVMAAMIAAAREGKNLRFS